MRTTVRVGAGVKEFIGTLAPEPRRRLRRALRDLEHGVGDITQLEGKLAPYWRLRVGRIRTVYAQKSKAGQRVLLCIYADYRPVVYQLVEQLLAQDLIAELRNF